jgi:hypothetical protein
MDEGKHKIMLGSVFSTANVKLAIGNAPPSGPPLDAQSTSDTTTATTNMATTRVAASRCEGSGPA